MEYIQGTIWILRDYEPGMYLRNVHSEYSSYLAVVKLSDSKAAAAAKEVKTVHETCRPATKPLQQRTLGKGTPTVVSQA
jgi:hypothetical protein